VSTRPLAEARSQYTTSAAVVIALAGVAAALALVISVADASLPFLTVRGFLLTGGALLLTATWLYGEGRALERSAGGGVASGRDRRR
jgi:hypothetical protein